MNKFTFFKSIIVLLFLNFIGVSSLQCYKCHSDDDPGCAIASAEHIPLWDHEKCADDVTKCAVWILDGDHNTYRGCSPKSIEGIHNITECAVDNCNNKLFPEDRLYCYQCLKDCPIIREEFYKVEPCVNYKVNDTCYTMVVDGLIEKTYRGCFSDTKTIGIEICTNETMSQFCVKAKINDQNATDSTFSCIECSVTEPQTPNPITELCYEKTQSSFCGKHLLGREPDKCFTILTPESIQRGCIKTDQNEKDCDEAKENCHVCDTTNCNSKVYPGIKCRKCNSLLDDNCEEKPDQYIYCVSDKEDEVMGCVLREDVVNGVKQVARGCLHTINNETAKLNCDYSGDTCKVCTTNECNNKLTYQQCIECDSSTDPNCATLKDLSNFKTVTCYDYADQCFALNGGIDKHGTRRGCVSHLPNPDANDENILTCERNNCNILPVPSHRIRCFQCDETSDDTCSISGSKLPPIHYCLKHDPTIEEECYTMIDQESNRIRRGCMTDLDPQENVCEGDTCKKCSAEGCNRQPKYSKSSLFCVKCEATPENKNNSCLWGHDIAIAEQCEATVEFGTIQKCFTKVDIDGGVKRGCLSDLKDVCPDSNSCDTCSSSGCNHENVIKQSCLICDSISDANCEKSNPEIEMKECPTKVQTFDERWCYTFKNERNNTIHRGCLSELTDDFKEECLVQKSKFCDICDTPGCNNKNPPNAATKPAMINLIYVCFISLLILLKY